MKLVLQKHEYGCAVAVLSMILDVEYDDIILDFDKNFDEEGMTNSDMLDYLTDYGKQLIIIETSDNANRKFMRDFFLTPFAPAHYISFQPYANSTMYHSVAMDNKGKILCPSPDAPNDIDYYKNRAYKVPFTVGVF